MLAKQQEAFSHLPCPDLPGVRISPSLAIVQLLGLSTAILGITSGLCVTVLSAFCDTYS